MRYRLKTPAGRTLYALRKQTAQPVFGIIKAAMGLRRFRLRGLGMREASGPGEDALEPQADVRPADSLRPTRDGNVPHALYGST